MTNSSRRTWLSILLLIVAIPVRVAALQAVRRADGAVRIHAARGSAQNPAFSPDGQTILLTWFHSGYDLGRAGIYTIPVNGRTLTRLLDEAGHQSVNLPGASWTAATNRIAFASDRIGTDEIWTIAPDGTNLFRVTTHTTALHFQEPSFSPDGQWIIFEADTDTPQQGSIWKVGADGTGLVQITNDPANDDREPNWSPAGDRIVFQRTPIGADSWDLYTVLPDGTGIQQVTNSGSDTDPSWSPDGQSLVYSSDQSGTLPQPNIWTVPAVGGTPVRVTRSALFADAAPSWSPDGKSIAFESHRSARARAALWRIAVPQPPPPPVDCPQCWHPALNTPWQWQLTGTVDQSVNADMYDIDLFDNDAGVVSSLHAKGRVVVCYISAGTWENWRPDASQFPHSVLGRPDYPWPGERWLDIRQLPSLAPIIAARLDQCVAKGFDGVEFDNVDGYANPTGFPLTYGDQITYNTWLANAAHTRGLSVALKNDLDQVTDLVPYFDWALNEECFRYQECDALLPFITAGKAVMQVEYALTTSQFCPQANAMNFNSMKKHLALDAYRVPCR